jgi:molecular chaperone GrpE
MKQKEDVNSDIANSQEEGNETNASENPGLEPESNSTTENLETELTKANDKYIRLYSDFENYKKRNIRERIEQNKMATAEVFLSLIPIIDDLERALKSAEEAKDLDSVQEGIRLIYSKVKNVTASKGLVPMDAIGKPFDPELHDAIANVPVEDKAQKGLIVEEIEKGYYLNDKVIRHAKVIVGN